MTQFFTNPAIIAEMIALVAATLAFFRLKDGYWGLFIPYMFIVLAVETSGYLFRINKLPNYILYNGLLALQLVFFTYLFTKFFDPEKFRRSLLIAGGVFIIMFLAESTSLGFASYNRISRLAFSWYIVFWSLLFYFELLRNDRIFAPIRYAPFWTITGLFFFYFGTAVMFSFQDVVSKIKLTGNISFYTLVMSCLSCILYGCWIIGFICQKIPTPSSTR